MREASQKTTNEKYKVFTNDVHISLHATVYNEKDVDGLRRFNDYYLKSKDWRIMLSWEG